MGKILFPYSRYIERMDGCELVQPVLPPSAPILVPEHHWEIPRVNLYGTVIKPDDDTFEMYYQCGNAVRVARATSQDGMRWKKPLVNRVDFHHPDGEIILATSAIDPLDVPELSEEGELTNIVAGYHMPSVVHVPDDEAPYKLFAFGEGGYHVAESSDGIRFKPLSEAPVIDLLLFKNPSTGKTWVSDVAPFFRVDDRYIAMVKTYQTDRNGLTRRCVGRAESTDLIHWSPVKTVWVPGEQEDEIARARGFEWADFYGLCPFPYGEGYLGYLWLFEIEKELPHGTHQGKIEVFLAHSLDGVQWHRVSEAPLIPWDLNFRGAGGMVTTPGAPIFEKDRVLVYYSDNNYEHGMFEKDFKKEIRSPEWVVRCAELPKERLLGVRGGHITTSWLPSKAVNRLRINLDASYGHADIRLIGREVGVLGAFHIENENNTDLTLELPKTDAPEIRLEISLSRATLYALGHLEVP